MANRSISTYSSQSLDTQFQIAIYAFAVIHRLEFKNLLDRVQGSTLVAMTQLRATQQQIQTREQGKFEVTDAGSQSVLKSFNRSKV